MIHQDRFSELKSDYQHDLFIEPAYGGDCISDIAPSILDFFGVPQRRPTFSQPLLERYKGSKQRVVMNLIDGFGFDHLVTYNQQFPYFQRLAERLEVYPLTSVFPSTTSAALTAVHTGLTPQEHGLPEWHVYFEEFDSIIETLPFRLFGTHEGDNLLQQGGTAEMLFDGTTMYERLQQAGIASYMFLFEAYANTAYSRSVHRGSTLVPFYDGFDLMKQLRELLLREKGPAYFFVYWGQIDSKAHEYGPDSPEHVQAIDDYSRLIMDELLHKLNQEDITDVLFLMTADHGHVNIKNEDIINLNRYPEIDRNLATGPNGKRILPTGSPHDVFLYIEPAKRNKVMSFLRQQLAERAEIVPIESAVKKGLFGLNQPIEKFLNRIGNVMILPYPGHHVWYEFFPDIPYRQLGIHGGMSEKEMFVPLAVGPMSELL